MGRRSFNAAVTFQNSLTKFSGAFRCVRGTMRTDPDLLKQVEVYAHATEYIRSKHYRPQNKPICSVN